MPIATARPRARSLFAGDVVGGKYLLVRQRATGARSVVWEAEHLALRRRCALKIFDTRGNAALPRAAEVRATAALDHRCLPRIHDVFAVHRHDIYVFVTPLFEGELLHRMVTTRGPLAVERAAALLDQLVGALAHAFERRVSFPHTSMRQLFVSPPSGSETSEHIKLLGFGRPIAHDVLGADIVVQRAIVHVAFSILRECVAEAPPAVDAFLSDATAQPSLAETRRILAALASGREVRG